MKGDIEAAAFWLGAWAALIVYLLVDGEVIR